MAKKTMFNLKVNKDGFCWQIVSNVEAKKICADNKEVYVLHDDDTESLIEDAEDFDEATWTFGIELGFISKDSVESFKNYITTKRGR